MKELTGPRGKRIRPKIGDVFEIPLPDGRFAYGRVYDDAGVGIYNTITELSGSPPIGCRDFMFNVGMYEDILKSGKWQIVGHDPFESDESAYPPPSYIHDDLSGEYSIYHRGEIRPASESECSGLEEAAVWDTHHIIERIMNMIEQ